MATALLAFFTVFASAALNLLVSTATMALGAFTVVSPARAAEIWGSRRFQNLAPERKASFLWWFRVLGIFLFLGGVFFGVDRVVFSSYPP